MRSIIVPAIAITLLASGCDDQSSRTDDASRVERQGLTSGVSYLEDITVSAGIDFVHHLADGDLSNIIESDGAGGAVIDFDGDGFVDLYFVNGSPDPAFSDAPPQTTRQPNRLYRNRGDGTFEDVTAQAGVAGYGFGAMAAAADYDNDGDTDLYVVNFGSGILYRNEGDGTFTDVTAESGLGTERIGIAATFLDVDRDGHLDLFVANYLVYDRAVPNPPGSPQPYPGPLSYVSELNLLFRNLGDGTFEDVSAAAGILVPGHRAMSVTPLDFDRDGDQDLYVSNDATPNLLLANDGQGRFHDVALERGVGFNQFGEAAGSMAATVGDCNGDGFPDLFVTRFGHASLYVNSAAGFFEDLVVGSGILNVSAEFVAWGGNFFELDNDGDLDLLIVNGDPHFLRGQPPLLLENDGRGNFTGDTSRGGPFFQQRINGRGSAALDVNNDGRLDLVISTLADRPRLLRNVAPSHHHWLMLDFEGTQSNRDGYGALISVTAGGRTWFLERRCPTGYVFQQDDRVHVGLGSAAEVDLIEIRWPSGQAQTLGPIRADQILQIREPGPSRWSGRATTHLIGSGE